MDLSLFVGIVGTIIEIIAIIIALFELIKSSKDQSEKVSVSLISYKETIVNKKSNTPTSNSGSSSSDSMYLIPIAGLIILIISLAFRLALSTILSFVTSAYLFKTIYFIRKGNISSRLSNLLVGRAILFIILSLSTYYLHPQLLAISNELPDFSQSHKGLSYFMEWFINSGKIIINNIINVSDPNPTNSFPYVYLLSRISGMAFIMSYLITEIREKSMLHQVYKFDIKPAKTTILNIMLLLILTAAFHINIIYFSIIIPILDVIINWMNN